MIDTNIILGIPTITQFDHLERCIDSALAGSIPPSDILVIDNSAGQCPRRSDVSYVVPSYNLGVAQSWNVIAEQAGDRPIIISNDDILFANDTIASLLAAADAFPRAGIISPIEGQRFSLFYLRYQAYREVGPFDDQFWPAYFEDNDYHRRLTLASWDAPIAYTAVQHVGSATMQAASKADEALHHDRFRACRRRYVRKWGGMPGVEVCTQPYGGQP